MDDRLSDVETYILNSKYRENVLRDLARNSRGTPKEIAERTDARRPHVSRALSELRELEVVELEVPESRTVGRYYRLTDTGEEIWSTICDEIQDISWSVEEPSNGTEKAIVDYALDQLGEHLRLIGIHRGEDVTFIYADPDVLSNYSDEDMARNLRNLIFDHSITEVNIEGREFLSEIILFSEISILRISLPDDTRLSLSFGNSHDIVVQDFAETLTALYDKNSADR